MRNREVWDAYDFYTSEISKSARTFGFAGIAICWFFRSPDVTFPGPILWSLIFFVVFFILDLAHYYTSAMRLRKWMRREEELRLESTGTIEHDDYAIPTSVHKPGHMLFHLKLAALVLGFGAIGIVFAGRV